jgi:5-methylcytosine-specific restriction endonuclease McrA
MRDKQKYNEYQRRYQLHRYEQRRAEALEALGGKCVRCGTIENLEMDHIVAAEKSFSISKLWSVSKERFEEELTKCQLLCSKCHLEKSFASGDIPPKATHGSHAMYRHYGCRCDPCRAATAEAHRESKRRKRERRG